MHSATHKPLRAAGLSLLGMLLLAAHAPHPPESATPRRVPTVAAISGPAEGLVCALLGDADVRVLVPTAAHGRVGRMREKYGLTACGSDGAFGRLALQQPDAWEGTGIDRTPRLAEASFDR